MIIAIAGLKGGTGKTTLSVSLASVALERGRTALLIDADPRGDSRTWASFAGPHAPPSFALPLGAGSTELRALALGIDIAIVDCPAGDPARLSTVLHAADFAVVPCGPSALDVWSLGTTFDAVREARATNRSLGAGVVINRGNSSTTLGRTVGDQLSRAGFPVMQTAVRQRVALTEAVGAGLSVTRAIPESHAAVEIEGLFDEIGQITAVRDAAAHPVQ